MIEIYADFEYRQDGKQLILGCFLLPGGERCAIDFRDPAHGARELRKLAARYPTATWFAYSALAELHCFLRAGLDISGMRWVCLLAEGRQITGNHRHYLARRGSLLATLDALGIATRGSIVWKEAMRDRILATDQYSAAEWAEIVDYCWSDIEPMPELWRVIKLVHQQAGHSYGIQFAWFRGDFLKAQARIEQRSRGFPVDTALLDRIFDNQKVVRKAVAESCNDKYAGGDPLFRYNKQRDEFSFNFKALAKHIAALPFPVDWEVTTNGRPRLDEDYLDEFCRANPYFSSLGATRRLLAQLKTNDPRELLERPGGEPFIKGTSLPFHTITGRSQPLTSRGFLFNLPPWIRRVVRPHDGHVIVCLDWSQEEIHIAARLSGDVALQAALATGDVYTSLAKQAGSIPPDGDKHSHPAERQMYKSAQLGVGYGMGAPKLGRAIYLDLARQRETLSKAGGAIPAAVSLDEAVERATEILAWHKQTFTAYWAFVNREVNVARARGWIHAKDGWTLFADNGSKYTKVQNFPMQSNGAVVLREAIKNVAETALEVVCTLHDAIYLYCRAEDAARDAAILKDCMDRASTAILGFTLPVDAPKVYTHATGMGSGGAMYDKIIAILDAEDAKKSLVSA